MADKIIKSFDIWTDAQGVKSKGRVRSIGNISLEGIARLRELILQLAVSGKLIMQDANDEPVSELLKRTKIEIEKLSKEGQIKSPKPLPTIQKSEHPFLLPSGWQFLRLNEVGDWGAGATPMRSTSAFYGGDIPWFKSGELANDYIDTSEEFITELALKETSLRYNKVGDVLIAMYGATIGKTSILNVRSTTNQAVCACTPFQCISNIFLLTLLKAYKNRFIQMGAGGAQPNISREKIINTVIALPPLAEQHRIVAKVEKLMALCDRLEQEQTANLKTHQTLVKVLLQTLTDAKDADDLAAAWQRLSPHFDTLFCTEDSVEQLKQTILQLAIMGRLVKQDPNDEPASELVKRIEKEKAKMIKEGKLKKEKPLPPISDEEKPFELPKGWEWLPFGKLGFFINGDRSKNYPHVSEYVNEGVPWINTGHIEPDGKLSKSDMNYISRTKFESLRSGKIQKYDLVYCLRGATFGKTAVVEPYTEGAIASSLMIIRPYLHELRDFIFRYLKSSFAKRQLLRFDNGSAQPNLSADSVTRYVFPLPPLAEQKRILAKVDELMVICDILKEKILRTEEVKGQLSKAIVEHAIA